MVEVSRFRQVLLPTDALILLLAFNEQRYIDEVLRPHVLPLEWEKSLNNGNTRPHRARIVE